MVQENAVRNGIVTGGTDLVGQPMDRVDGRAKVTGAAKYAAEQPVKDVAHAVAFTSTIAKGRVVEMDVAAAERSPGVLAVITRRNAPRMNQLTRDMKLTGQPGQTLPVLQDDQVHYAGQYLGLVVAQTFEQARHAAGLVKIRYQEEPHTTDPAHPVGDLVPPKKIGRGDKPDYERGDAAGALAKADVRIEQTYTTAVEHHNPMEMHATIAAWEGDRLTLYDSTQHVLGVKSVGAAILGIAPEKIRVISPFLGGAFGCKGSVWPNVALAAIAAQYVGRPVKLMLTRQQMFSQVGYRPKTIQKISLGADKNGRLVSTIHDCISQTSDFDDWVEPSAKQTRFLYSCPNVRSSHRMARVNAGTPCQMRAPGEASGTAVFEIAMDELAYAVNVDPLEIRLRNYAERDEGENKPYTSKALRECYRLGAQRFGWEKRSMAPGSMKDGRTLIGWGMATATYPTNHSPSSASARIFPDGRVVVSAAAHDLGTGTYTIMTQIAAQSLGVPVEKVAFRLGDSIYPQAPVAGGSQTAVSVGCAVQNAASALVAKLAHLAVNDPASPLQGKNEKQVTLKGDRLVLRSDASVGQPLAEVFKRNNGQPIEASADSAPSEESQKYSKHAWGAQFAEVRIDPDLREIRVSRFVGAFAAGRVLNAKTARSQVMGGIVMAIGMALLEHTVYDPARGKIVTDNLADYLVPVNADIPAIDCFFVDEKDEHVNSLGAKGVGELGITGAAAAVANAVFHATGRRLRDLPITLDMLL